MSAYFATLRQFNRDTRLFMIMWALMAFGYFGIQGVLFNLYLLRLGYGPEFIGLLIGLGQLVWALAALPAGMAGSRWGLRNAMMLAQCMTAAGAASILLAEGMPASMQDGWLAVSWMVMWIGAALQTVNSPPYLMQATQPAVRNHAFSVQQATIALFALLGGLAAGVLPGLIAGWLGSELSDPAPYRLALAIAPLAYGLVLFVLSAMQPATVERHAHIRTEGQAAPVALFAGFVFSVFLYSAAEGTVRAFFNVYLDASLHAPVAQIGAIMGISQVLPVAAALAAPILLLRLGNIRTMALMALALALGLVLLAWVHSWVAAAAGFMFMVGAGSIGGTARNLLGQESVPPRWRTTMSALSTIGLALGWATTAALGGYVIEAMGFGTLFAASAGLAAGSAVVVTAWVGSRWVLTPAAPSGAD